MRTIGCLFWFWISLASLVSAQEVTDYYETGKEIFGSNFTDFDPGPLQAGGLNVIGIFDDIPGDDTQVMEVEVPGDTVNSWDELLQLNFDTPENSKSIIWRIQYRIQVTNAPYQIEMRMQINQDPWDGFSVTNTIPEKYQAKWIFFDYITPMFALFTTDQINFSFRFGAQSHQLLHLDDIHLYISNALKLMEFESLAESRTSVGIGAALSRLEMEGAPEGLYVLKALLSGIEKPKIFFPPAFPHDYVGAYRCTLTMRTDVVPMTIKFGMANQYDLSDHFIYSPENQIITEKNSWQVLSFPIPPWPFGEKRLYPFIEFDKTGAEILLDRVATLKTDEKIVGPAAIGDWCLY